MQFEFTIAGIPCIIDATVEAYTPAWIQGPSHHWHDSEGGGVEYTVFDRKGYRAKWLERKITPKIHAEIVEAAQERV